MKFQLRSPPLNTILYGTYNMVYDMVYRIVYGTYSMLNTLMGLQNSVGMISK